MPFEGIFHNLLLVDIDKRYPGHARKVMSALWGMGQAMFSKCIIVLDEGIDLRNYAEVAWKTLNNIDPERDIQFTLGPIDSLDHASRLPNFGSKMGIDATSGGGTAYSASKAGAEIVISSFTRSFFEEEETAWVASARAGNVVGGGDWSEFRLIPDCVRSLRDEVPIKLRSPQATRPWQFVLEPLAGYLLLGKRLVEEGKVFQGAWNFGPPVDNTKTVEHGAQATVEAWGEGTIERLPTAPFHESMLLQLDSTKARRYLGWRSVVDFSETMQLTTDWYKHQHTSGDASMREYSMSQLDAFEELLNREVSL